MQPVHTVVFDTFADVTVIKHYLSIPGHVVADVESLFRTQIAGGSLIKAEHDLVAMTSWGEVVELGTSNAYIPLRIDSPEAVAATILSGFSPLKPDEAVLLQWVVTPTRHQAVPEPERTSWFSAEVDASRAKAKLTEPLFLAVGRLASKGESAEGLIRRLYTGLSSTHAYRMKFTRQVATRNHLTERIRRRSGMLVFPATLNALELSVVIGYPFGAPNVPGLPMGRARHLAPDHMIPSEGGIGVGRSSFPGMEDRRLAIPIKGLMMHEWVIGPTGSGKSALLHNQATDLMKAGHGLALIEPKGDLARDVLSTVPQHRVNDVIWFDPTDAARPIGLNVLAGPDPERTASHIVGLFKALYGDSWGPRLE